MSREIHKDTGEGSDQALIDFLKDLRGLCDKHNAEIGGCGCCGSPFGKVGNITFDSLSADKDKAVLEKELPLKF